MQQNSEELLLKILELIDYKEDKEKFIDQFLTTCHQNTILDLLESLPEQQKQIIANEIGQKLNPEDLQKILLKTFSKEKVETTFEDNFWKSLEQMLTTINLSLSSNQKTNLAAYLTSL